MLVSNFQVPFKKLVSLLFSLFLGLESSQSPQLTSACKPLTWWQHSGTGWGKHKGGEEEELLT